MLPKPLLSYLPHAENLRRSNFFRHAAVLTSGTAISQLLLVISAPVLSRLYTPDAFGILGVFTALVSWPTVIAGLRYEQAVVLAQDDEEAHNLFVMTLAIITGAALMSAGAVWLAGTHIATLIGAPEITQLLWFLPVSVMALGYYNAFNYRFTRDKQFSTLATAKVTRSVGTIGAQASGGLMNLAGAGLIAGQIFGQMLGLLQLGWRSYPKLRSMVPKLSLSRMRQLGYVHKGFPLYQAPQSLLNSFSQTLPTLLFGALFGPVVVGWYWFTHRLLKLPSEMIGQSVRQVFFQRASELRNDYKPVYTLFKKTTLALLSIAIFPTIVIVALGPQLFALVFGSEWEPAGVYGRWIVMWWIAGFINPPAITMFAVLNIQHRLLIYEVGLFMARAVAIAAGALWGSALWAVALFSLVGMSFNLGLVGYTWLTLRRRTLTVTQT